MEEKVAGKETTDSYHREMQEAWIINLKCDF